MNKEEMRDFQGLLDTWAAAGSGGKSGPSEDPDTLRSKASAKVLAVFSEGPIQGFPEGITELERNKRIFLDDTPLVSDAGVSMFSGQGPQSTTVDVRFRNGTQNQRPISGFNDIRIEQSLGIQVQKNIGPISVTTTNSLLNQIVVRVGVASLFRVRDDGDIKGTKVEFFIDIRKADGTLVNADNRQFFIQGKTRGPFDQEYAFPLSGTGPWSVSVTRITDDSTSVTNNSDLYFRAIVGIINETLRYPNSALMGLQVSSENFQSVPQISALLQGLKIRVPNIYNPATGEYSGVWNGQWKTEYSNNPVWVFFDLLTDKRYGAGLFINQDDVDIYGLLPIAKYCDELVPNGKGGKERRFTFNAYINNRAEAFEVLNALASTFRGMLYYAQGAIVATQDVPKRPAKIFSPSNVVVEVDENNNLTSPAFSYEGTARKARKTVALVSWNDPSDRYKAKIEYVEDRDGIKRYGYREIDVRGFGCTSQAQAQRLGAWTLLTNLYETETVTFRVGAEGFFLLPGEVIEIADPDKNTGILAGIATSVNDNKITVDRQVVLAPGISYEIIVSNQAGTNVVRQIIDPPGAYEILTTSRDFPESFEAPLPWILRETVATPRTYKIVALSEDSGTVTVLATAYNREKFDLVDKFARADAQLSSVPRLNIVPVVTAGSIKLQVT
jgi:predicted phage tail protein